MMLRGWIWSLLLVTAGCEPISALMHKQPEVQEAAEAHSILTTSALAPKPVGDMPFHELIPLVRSDKQMEEPSIKPHTWYGTWVRDQGNTRTWLRVERPLIHIVGIDKKADTTWVMDGHYAVAANGMMYGVMTSIDTAAANPERTRALWDGDERVLRGRRGDKKLMPFSCRFTANGPELTLADFQGTSLEHDRDSFLHGRYQQTSLGRPSVAVPGAPLGVRESDRGKLRVTMVLQPGRVEFRLADRSGRRINVAGNYDVANDGIILGVLTSVEHGEVGKAMAKGKIEPQVFCFHFGLRGTTTVIDEVHSLHLERSTEECLIGEYRLPRK
jgi:hypothetical protein